MLLSVFSETCAYFGVPLPSEKTVWLTTCIYDLGIVIDLVSTEFHLPLLKTVKARLLALVSKVMPTGMIFCRRLASMICGIRNYIFHKHLTKQANHP